MLFAPLLIRPSMVSACPCVYPHRACIKCGSSALIRETTDGTMLYDTALHSGSTQLNYEWRSIPREGKRRGRSRCAATREELRGFRGKIKKGKWNTRRQPYLLSATTIQKLMSNIPIPHCVIRPIYPSECDFLMSPSFSGQAELTHWPQTVG